VNGAQGRNLACSVWRAVRAGLSASFTYGRKDATDRENPVVLPRNRKHVARAALRNVGGTLDRTSTFGEIRPLVECARPVLPRGCVPAAGLGLTSYRPKARTT
jgi:hypothetical protein